MRIQQQVGSELARRLFGVACPPLAWFILNRVKEPSSPAPVVYNLSSV